MSVLFRHRYALILALVLAITALVYLPGLSGGFLFDDFPNIVDNAGVQPTDATVPNLVRAAYSSPSSDFKRPLASLSFAVNYLVTGLDPSWMKLTNLIIHLLNGFLVYLVATRIVRLADVRKDADAAKIIGLFITAGWLLLPINLTAVLYVVQRMESLANFFVLAGLLGYIAGRERMLQERAGFAVATLSIVAGTALGLLAKETAVMLPLYAAASEWIIFRSKQTNSTKSKNRSINIFFFIFLVLPLIAGSLWIFPRLFRPETWTHRDFTMGTRLLSEARIVIDYVYWTFAPLPHALSFYHDDFVISTSLLQPWTTATSLLGIVAIVAGVFFLRQRAPVAALGLAFFVSSNLLTGTVIPLELIYEHRNYFASFGLILFATPLLVALPSGAGRPATLLLARRALLAALLFFWAMQTTTTAIAWGNPLSLAREFAWRAPNSPRAQYELGRTYIIDSKYSASSPFTALAYPALERAANLPGSTILPEQALIFFNAHLHRPIEERWWRSMQSKLQSRPAGVQDESSLEALVRCVIDSRCELSQDELVRSFQAALSHSPPSARLLAIYADYAWNSMGDRILGISLMTQAVKITPGEPAYRLTYGRMLATNNDITSASEQLSALVRMNQAGRVDKEVNSLTKTIEDARTHTTGKTIDN